MSKKSRHGSILSLIDRGDMSTQSQLAAALSEQGFHVTQTTVSRDLAELGLIKVRNPEGQLVYARPGTADHDQLSALAIAMQRWVLDVQVSQNLVIVHTPNGYAAPVSQALDESGHPKVVGTIAGENTVIVVAAETTTGSVLASELRRMMERGSELN